MRRAAAIAGVLGAVRYGTLQTETLLYSSSSGGQEFNVNCTISSPFVAAVIVPLAIGLWLASVAFAGAVSLRSRHAAP